MVHAATGAGTADVYAFTFDAQGNYGNASGTMSFGLAGNPVTELQCTIEGVVVLGNNAAVIGLVTGSQSKQDIGTYLTLLVEDSGSADKIGTLGTRDKPAEDSLNTQLADPASFPWPLTSGGIEVQ
jgi:hypothetical protein